MSDIIWTKTDEAPLFASYSLFPIIKSFLSRAGISITRADISLAGRILSLFSKELGLNKADELELLGELTAHKEANIIKLPNISATLVQLKAAIEELRSKGINVPFYPDEIITDYDEGVAKKYQKVLGSAVNPVLRQGNSDRRVLPPVKEFAKKHPHSNGDWDKANKAKICYMQKGDFYENEHSIIASNDEKFYINFISKDGKKELLKELAIQSGEIVDATFLSVEELDKFYESCFETALKENLTLSLHLKCTMMKVSDPVIFAHAIKSYFKDVFEKFGDEFKAHGVEAKNGLKDMFSKISQLKNKDEILAKFDEILSYKADIITPFKFQSLLLKRAKVANKTVVLPESDDERILKAAHIVLEKGAANIILLGLEDEISKKATALGLNLSKAKVINPEQNELTDEFAKKIYELRKHKGVDEVKANALAKDKIYFATMLIHEGLADALVSGATMSTADTIRPALQIIKTKQNVSVVSGAFFMALEEEILLFADCAVTPNPSADELASITLSSAQTASAFGISPKIAMLSYSTADSGSGPDVEFIKEVAKKASELDANLKIAAPIQFDAAVDLSVASKKMPNSEVAGHANVFIFPNLNCGNICYKAVQRSANALAVGPILQGLKKPVNDLSRGCLVEDVVNTILISAIQAGE